MNLMKILVIEDEPDLADALRQGFEHQGYVVDVAAHGLLGWDMLETYTYDALVLDRRLPGLEGVQLCRRLRQQGFRLPVLMLTARDTIEDRVEGLQAGADDYLVKPFDFRELQARVQALLRRQQPEQRNRLEVDDLVLDLETTDVSRAGLPLALSRKEYLLLALLLRHRGQVVPPDRIMEQLWDADGSPSPEIVRAHIKNLRKKVDGPSVRKLIRTVHGMGYRLDA